MSQYIGHTLCRLEGQQGGTIDDTLKMADQRWSDMYVAFIAVVTFLFDKLQS